MGRGNGVLGLLGARGGCVPDDRAVGRVDDLQRVVGATAVPVHEQLGPDLGKMPGRRHHRRHLAVVGAAGAAFLGNDTKAHPTQVPEAWDGIGPVRFGGPDRDI